jgi:hypothetical protein
VVVGGHARATATATATATAPAARVVIVIVPATRVAVATSVATATNFNFKSVKADYLLSLMTNDLLNSRLPNIELSYGEQLHRKVQSDFYQLIPQGNKCLVWYTYLNGDNVCFILHLSNNSESITTVEKTFACFNDDLCYGKGTILSGYIFKYKNVNILSAVDIHYYKGDDLYNTKNHEKNSIMCKFFSEDTRQEIYSVNQLLVAFPLKSRSYADAIALAKTCSYPVHSISLINETDTKTIGYYKYIPKTLPYAMFLIKAQIGADIYNLYIEDAYTPYGIAAITNYKTSVMMNKCFRKIKENDNLDLLEESDDEEDFENINCDKYVDLFKSEIVKCVYIPKFKKWKPVAICEKNTSITSKRDVVMMEKNSLINKLNYAKE